MTIFSVHARFRDISFVILIFYENCGLGWQLRWKSQLDFCQILCIIILSIIMY